MDFLHLLISVSLFIDIAQCERPRTVSHVKYKLLYVEKSILLSYKHENVSYRFHGDIDPQYKTQPDVYLTTIENGVYGVKRMNDSVEMLEERKACDSYFARNLDDPQTVASIDLCNETLSGLVLTAARYMELVDFNQTHLEIQAYPIPQLTKDMIKAVYRPRENQSRLKRETDFDVYARVTGSVEVAVFTEYRTYQGFCSEFSSDDVNCTDGSNTLNLFIQLSMKGADLFYKRINNEQLKINLVVKAIYHNARRYDPQLQQDLSIFQPIEIYDSGVYFVDSSKGLDLFSIYQQTLLNQIGALADHSILFTVHEMIDEEVYLSGDGSDFRTIGIAYVEAICDVEVSSSMVQIVDQGLAVLFVIAHEIAHTLGADHDGKYTMCIAEDNYIMAPWNQKKNLNNIFYFSCCSQLEILKTIQKYGWCMDTYDPETDHELYLAGKVVDRSIQCSIAFNDLYTPCYDDQYIDKKSLCTVMACKTNDSLVCELATDSLVLPGTDCGDGMWCLQGLCVDNSDPFDSVVSSYQPRCDYAQLNENLEYIEGEVESKLPNIGELFGRYSSLLIGGVVLAAGVLLSLFQRNRKRSPVNKQAGTAQYQVDNPVISDNAVLNNQPMGGALPNNLNTGYGTQYNNLYTSNPASNPPYDASKYGGTMGKEDHNLFT